MSYAPWPEPFLQNMRRQLENPGLYKAFLEALGGRRTAGLRFNPLKTTRAQFLQLVPFDLEPVPWCAAGFYFDELVDHPGRHALHAAGLFYVQEPSAMSVVPALDVQREHWVLDMCAAPGGKSTQLAADLDHTGVLVANEIHPKRLKALGENLERWGSPGTVITQEDPSRLAQRWGPIFQRILLDAPCSGEGMFRKDAEAVATWSLAKVTELAALQRRLLAAAHDLLAPGGLLVYSTCTFNEEENERQVEHVLQEFPRMSLQRQERLWPHKQRGEGHFYAVFQKNDSDAVLPKRTLQAASGNLGHEETRLWSQFRRDYLLQVPLLDQDIFALQLRRERLYLIPKMLPTLVGLRVLRSGVELGQFKKGRFEPSHGLALLLQAQHCVHGLELDPDDPALEGYLTGHVLPGTSARGWGLVSAGGHGVGWAKESGGKWKNHYPKGLRRSGSVH